MQFRKLFLENIQAEDKTISLGKEFQMEGIRSQKKFAYEAC